MWGLLAAMNGIDRQYPVCSQGIQNRFITSSLALSKNGKYKHSLMPHKSSTSHVIFPALNMLLGGCNWSNALASVPKEDPSSSYPFQTCFFEESLEDISIATCIAPLQECLISQFESSFVSGSDFFSPQQIAIQAQELTKQVRNPTPKEKLTPKFVKVQGVTKTLAISPNQGRIKMTPAYFPIHDDAICPWIMYSIQAPMPSKILPPISSQKQRLLPSPPKMATRSCPKERAIAPTQRSFAAILVQKNPRGMMTSIEMALGMEQSRLNCVTLMSCICYKDFCMV